MHREISNRIWITRYLMIIGIVILHVPPYVPVEELSNSLFGFIKGFFSHGLFRTTVPMLTAISGYLIFHSGLYKDFTSLFKKKLKAIVVPLIIWNLPFVIALYFVQKYELVSHTFSVHIYPFELMNLINGIVGLTASPVNYPLNFLRDLFAVALLAPLMGIFLRRYPYIGLVAVIVVYIFDLERLYVLRNSMLISFYVGGLAATQDWDLKMLDRFAWPFLALLCVLCTLIVYLNIHNLEWFRLISPVLVWPCMSLIAKSKIEPILLQDAKNSFLIFLSHGPILLFLWLVYSRYLTALPYPLFWLSTPVVTVGLCKVLRLVLLARMPVVTSVAIGGRRFT